MDRLIKADVQVVDLLFIRGQKCSKSFKLTNLMHTMSVAISLTTSNPSIFSFSHPFYIIPPLSTASFTLLLTKPCDHPPLSTPPDTILVRSSILPTGKAHQDDLRRLFSKPGPHIFKDATIPISFVGHHVAEYLLSPSSRTLEINILFAKAISFCDESQLNSLLKTAARNGKPQFISALIQAGADVNNRDSDGESAMSLAVKSGNTAAVKIVIESGSTIDNKIDRFLHEATAMNRVDLMETLCLAYVDLELNSRNPQGQTPLHIAAIHGHIESIQFLISIGSDPDAIDSENWTPLHHAANEGHGEAVEFLLNHSIFSKYALTKQGKTAFTLAMEKGNSHLYDMLQLGDLMHRAARNDDVHAMKTCLSEGAKVNGRDQNGWTALHRAAFKGHLESVKLLIGHGARVDVVDGMGYTPLLRAVEAGHVHVAMCLLSNGAKANVKSIQGMMVNCDCNLECFQNHPSLVNYSLHQEKERA